MKTVTVTCTWQSSHEVEVPDDFTDTGHLSDFPLGVLDALSAHTAELTDWEVHQ